MSAILFEIADEVLEQSNITPDDLRLGVAIWLFQEKKLSLGKAAKIAGLHKMVFQKELGKRKIPLHYTEDDLLRDFKSAQSLP